MKRDDQSSKNDTDTATAATSSCPVMKDPSSSSSSSSPSPPPSWWNKLTFASPTPQHQLESLQQPSACPMVNNNKTTTVASLEEAAKYAQTPQPDQRFPLRTDRQVSSIPRGGRSSADTEQQPLQIPHHQLTTVSSTTTPTTDAAAAADAATLKNNTSTNNHHPNWVYPSEQQLYNAMRRKGWQNVPVDSIPTVLQIHNSINERTWDKVLEWEYMGSTAFADAGSVPTRNNENNNNNNNNNNNHGAANNNNIPSSAPPPPPRLLRFEGRPKDLTPKAFLFSNILRLSDPPFDRHDWYVESYPNGNNNSNSTSNNNSRPVAAAVVVVQRYVIDYYMTEQHDPFSVPIPYVDARPAVDSPRAVWMRTRRFLQDAFPGITSYYWRYQQQQQQQQAQQQQQQAQAQQQQQQQQAQPK